MRVKPVRRIVCVDGRDGKSRAIHDGPAPDVHGDPARPGFSSTLIWATDATPARIDGASEPPSPPQALSPPPGGSLCRVVTFPPDRAFRGGARVPHAGMHKARTLDFCLVLEGEITLVLDSEEVELKAGDTVVQRGTRHAWSNRSHSPCVVAISSHDATY
ncbi:MAG TPA: cupin domain-containing protein [Gemmatimonadales bacterium]|nr:cupin domain-containing protein [Gemmatimonadales bacterium]